MFQLRDQGRSLAGGRKALLAGLLTITGLAWLYLIDMAMDMSSLAEMLHAFTPMSMATEPVDMESMDMTLPMAAHWGLKEASFVFIMWLAMIMAMMIPASSAMILSFQDRTQQLHMTNPLIAAIAFALGYLSIWFAFGVVATGFQLWLNNMTLLDPMWMVTSSLLCAVILLGAGGYQLSAAKQRCLERCRARDTFLRNARQSGRASAFAMGLSLGLWCLGCCWALMVLMFVGGVMNVLWMSAITILILIERLLPKGNLTSRIAGLILLAAGVQMFPWAEVF